MLRKSLNRSILILVTVFFSCKKDLQPSFQTILLLQSKWSLSSETLTYPTNPSINTSYSGIPTDYYLFNSNDTVIIHQAGDPIVANNPYNVAIRYSLPDNNSIILYGQIAAGNIYLSIQKISMDTLILTNAISASFTNNGGITQTIYNGTRTVTLTK